MSVKSGTNTGFCEELRKRLCVGKDAIILSHQETKTREKALCHA